MNETVIQKSTTRVIELDALRALAALNLMLFHFTYVYQVKYGFSAPLGWQLPFGKYGVQLFFMLSGFVNAMTLLRKRQADEFLAARLIRILPSFYLLVGLNLILLTLSPLNRDSGYTLSQVAANLTLMPNLFGYECLEPVTWTLQIELLFYGILLLLFLAGAFERPFRPLILYLLLCLVGGTVVSRMPPESASTLSGGLVTLLNDLLLFQYMPLFLIGIFLYQLKADPEARPANGWGVLLSAIVFHLVDEHGHNPAVTVALIGLLGWSAFGKISLLRTPIFVFLSGISYSLYLVHNNLGCVLMHQLDRFGMPAILCLALALMFSILIAALVTYYLERPMSRWLNLKWKQLKPAVLPISAPTKFPLAGPPSGSATE